MRFFVLPLFLIAILFQSCKKDILTEQAAGNSFQFDLAAGEPVFDPANTMVLIVGVLTYQDAAALESFDPYHRKDVELMETLESYGVPNENIIGLFDEEATRENIYKSLHKIAVNSNAETNFIFYFAGHGFNGWDADKTSIYFANYDIKYLHPDKTGFNINFLSDHFFPEFPGKSVLLMGDCCKSGGLVDIAEQFSMDGKQAIGITSCFYSEWSTGNWTFTQKIIDAFKGDGLIDADKNGTITLDETMQGVERGLKFVDRQKSSSAYFNCVGDEVVSSVTTTYPEITDDTYSVGQYVFGKYKKNYCSVEITGKSGTQIQARYYNFADYISISFNPADLKIPYFVHYTTGDDILLDNFTDKPGYIMGEEDDFFELHSADGEQILWRTYEQIISGDEIPAMILDATGIWVSGEILDQTADAYYVTYTGKNYQWDEWVSPDRVDF